MCGKLPSVGCEPVMGKVVELSLWHGDSAEMMLAGRGGGAPLEWDVGLGNGDKGVWGTKENLPRRVLILWS